MHPPPGGGGGGGDGGGAGGKAAKDRERVRPDPPTPPDSDADSSEDDDVVEIARVMKGLLFLPAQRGARARSPSRCSGHTHARASLFNKHLR